MTPVETVGVKRLLPIRNIPIRHGEFEGVSKK